MATGPLGQPSPPTFSLRSLFVLMAVVVLLIGILVPLVRASREAARLTQCSNNLREIGLALQHYEKNYGRLPVAFTSDAVGKPLHSWRTPLLPFMEQLGTGEDDLGAYYGRLHWNERWDSPSYSRLRAVRFPFFICPDDNAAAEHNNTSYLAVIGAGTAWPGRTAAHLPNSGEEASETVLLVEAADSGIHWMEPRDVKLDGLDCTLNGPSTPGISSKHANGVNILFADASVRCLPRETPPSNIETMLTNRNSEGRLKTELEQGKEPRVDHPQTPPASEKPTGG